MAKTSPRIVAVPSSWMLYDLGSIELNDYQMGPNLPSIAVFEALVMVGKVKRVAAIHTFNGMAEPDREPPESPFLQGDEEEEE